MMFECSIMKAASFSHSMQIVASLTHSLTHLEFSWIVPPIKSQGGLKRLSGALCVFTRLLHGQKKKQLSVIYEEEEEASESWSGLCSHRIQWTPQDYIQSQSKDAMRCDFTLSDAHLMQIMPCGIHCIISWLENSELFRLICVTLGCDSQSALRCSWRHPRPNVLMARMPQSWIRLGGPINFLLLCMNTTEQCDTTLDTMSVLCWPKVTENGKPPLFWHCQLTLMSLLWLCILMHWATLQTPGLYSEHRH